MDRPDTLAAFSAPGAKWALHDGAIGKDRAIIIELAQGGGTDGAREPQPDRVRTRQFGNTIIYADCAERA